LTKLFNNNKESRFKSLKNHFNGDKISLKNLLSGLKTKMALSLIFVISVLLINPYYLKAQVSYYNGDAYSFFNSMVNSGMISPYADSFAVAMDENIYIGGYANTYSQATVRYSTIGLRVHFGDSAQWYVDLPCNYARCFYNGVSLYARLCTNNMKTNQYYGEQVVGDRVYSLFILPFTNLQRQIVDCYGVGSAQAQWIAANSAQTVTKRLYIDHIFTKSVIYDYNLYPDSGGAHIYKGYYDGFIGVYYDNNPAACASFDRFRQYYYNSTGAWLNDDFYYSNYNIPLSITVDPGDGLAYRQIVYYRKKDYKTGTYKNFSSSEIGGAANPSYFYASYGSYFYPSYLNKTPKGYKKEKISPTYKLIDLEANDINSYYVDYTPISYKVRFNPNGATAGTMEPQSLVYDYNQSLNSNQYKKEYSLNFDYMGGEGDKNSLLSSYIFKGWSLNKNDSDHVFKDKAGVVNLSATENATVDLYAIWTGGDVLMPDANKPHYSFVGWTKDRQLAENANESEECPDIKIHENQSYIPSENENFYAVWYSFKPEISAEKFVANEADKLKDEILLENVIATDVEDGDISKELVITDYDGLNLDKPKAGNYLLQYSVTDYSGKITTFEREVEILNVPPTLECKDVIQYNFGRAKITKEKLLKKMQAKAEDVYDGDLTSKIEIVEKSGLKYDDKSNPHKDYKIKLSVTDSNGAEVTKEANVKIIYRFVHFKKYK